MFWFLSFSDLHSNCVYCVSTYSSYPKLSVLTWEEAYAVEAWYVPDCLYWHWENNDQNVFMGWYSMVYYLFWYCVCILFPKIMMGWLAGVFIVSLNLCNVWNFNHVDKFEFIFFPPPYCRPVLSPEVYFVMFSLYCYVWCSKLSLGTQQAWRCVFGKYFRLKYNWKHSPFDLTQSIVVKVQCITKGLTEHFNPGQCWWLGCGVTC